jgi:hypothetical protein
MRRTAAVNKTACGISANLRRSVGSVAAMTPVKALVGSCSWTSGGGRHGALRRWPRFADAATLTAYRALRERIEVDFHFPKA